MNIAVFTNAIGGHHLEYIHHVYEMALKDRKNMYYFILPILFNNIKNNFIWTQSDNITICVYEENLNKETNNFFSQIVSSYKISRVIKRYIHKYRCNFIYMNTIIGILPLGPYILKSCNCKIAGIIYKIYLYDNNTNLLSKAANILKYKLLSRCSVFSNVLILNDEESVRDFNNIYKTNRFKFIPDPYIKLPTKKTFDIRKKYNIDNGKVVFSHIGALSNNKSTLEIIRSLSYLNDKEKRKYVFIFAGSIHSEIKNEFYNLETSLKGTVDIIVEDKYCSYEELASFCLGSNALLIPYKRTSQSSGIIGYASQFACPVIAPSKGLLGSIVKKYNLGVLIEDISTECLINAYRRIENNDYDKPSSKYCEDNNIERFQSVLMSCINQIQMER